MPIDESLGETTYILHLIYLLQQSRLCLNNFCESIYHTFLFNFYSHTYMESGLESIVLEVLMTGETVDLRRKVWSRDIYEIPFDTIST